MIGSTNSVIQIGTGGTGGTNGFPIEISDAAELTAELSNTDNIGKLYRYTGTTTNTYNQNEMYICTDDEGVVY